MPKPSAGDRDFKICDGKGVISSVYRRVGEAFAQLAIGVAFDVKTSPGKDPLATWGEI